MISRPIQTGVLAYGMSGKLFHVPFIANNPKFALRAVTERSKKQAHLDYPSVLSYDSVDELLADDQIELVVVNTPNNTHFEFAEKAILAGKHVLIEKPMVPTVAEAEHLFALGKEHGKQVLVYQNRRWDSDFKMMEQVLVEGKLGLPIEAHFRFDRYRAAIGAKAFKEKPLPGSGIAYDLGSHLLDQVICLFGIPEKSLKIGTKNRADTEVEDYVNFILSYANGLEVYVTVSYLVADPGVGYIIHGTKGSFKKARTDVQETQLLAGLRPTDPIFGKEDATANGSLTVYVNNQPVHESLTPLIGNYTELFSSVYSQIREDVPFPVTEQQILEQLKILEQEFWNQTNSE